MDKKGITYGKMVLNETLLTEKKYNDLRLLLFNHGGYYKDYRNGVCRVVNSDVVYKATVLPDDWED